VAASITINRDRESWLILYPLDGHLYPTAAADDFAARILPALRSWLDAQVTKPDTAILGCEEIVVEWCGLNHELHRLRYL
jgi:hypothetical protein